MDEKASEKQHCNAEEMREVYVSEQQTPHPGRERPRPGEESLERRASKVEEDVEEAKGKG